MPGSRSSSIGTRPSPRRARRTATASFRIITTENAARDMDLMRAVLGDERLHYLGYSYGTLLGAVYANLYPDRVGRLVFDGAVDPSLSMLEVDFTQGLGFESALRAYMADCLEIRECPFRGTVDEAMADLGTLLASVDRSPLSASDGRKWVPTRFRWRSSRHSTPRRAGPP